MKCVFRFSLKLLSATFFVLREMIKNVYWSACKVPVKADSHIGLHVKYPLRPIHILVCM